MVGEGICIAREQRKNLLGDVLCGMGIAITPTQGRKVNDVEVAFDQLGESQLGTRRRVLSEKRRVIAHDDMHLLITESAKTEQRIELNRVHEVSNADLRRRQDLA
jgi:predicted regulator of amino acid metabolism with ACT domain